MNVRGHRPWCRGLDNGECDCGVGWRGRLRKNRRRRRLARYRSALTALYTAAGKAEGLADELGFPEHRSLFAIWREQVEDRYDQTETESNR